MTKIHSRVKFDTIAFLVSQQCVRSCSHRGQTAEDSVLVVQLDRFGGNHDVLSIPDPANHRGSSNNDEHQEANACASPAALPDQSRSRRREGSARSRKAASIEATPVHDARQGGVVFGVGVPLGGFLLVGQDGLQVDALAHDRLDVIAASGLFDVGCKGPLAHAPVGDGAPAVIRVLVARHILQATPVALSRDLAKVLVVGVIVVFVVGVFVVASASPQAR
mmetsp:Transcript_23183/g.49371  ORF Transcript_23183/g.49371 Transcript_23183/m.49371 type:complete len:221 (-) Transcript_23183:572-1234(-)